MGSATVQGSLWGAAAADWVDNEVFALPIYQAVFDALQIDASTRLLDVGCGAGLAMTIAAERGAQVTGIDASAGLLAVARQRLPHADLREGEIEELPYQDDSFTVVTSFNAVQYAADPVNALRQVRRVVVDGGHVAIVTWGDPANCESRTILAAVGSLLPPPPAGAGGPFALSAPGKLAELATAAGLTPLTTADVATPFTFANLDEALRIQMSAGPLQRAAEVAGLDVTRKTLAEAFAPYRQADGSYVQHNEFRYLLAAA